LRVVVLGGAGLTGKCAVQVLAERDEVTEGLVADLDGEKAKLASDSVGRGKFEAARVDVKDSDATAKLIRGYDVVINAVQYYFNLDVMSASLKAGVNYLDFGGLYHTTLKQLKLDDEFRKRNLVALLGMGAQPGITNVLARHAVDSLDEVESIRIRDGARDLTEGVPPFVVTWSLDTFLDELTMEAPVFEDGATKLIPPLSRSEEVDFHEPVGKVQVYSTIHSEVATLPQSFAKKGIQKVDWMEGIPGIEALRLLVSLGLASKEEVDIRGVKVSPRGLLLSLVRRGGLMGHPPNLVPDDWEITRVLVSGKSSGKSRTLQYDVTIPPRKDWKMSCSQYGVGVPASIGALMIGNGTVKARGVVPPESCIETSAFMKELERYGFKIAVS
jgi:saccharopine dehydrogenase-like NADP-dependent oxidoreductase